MIRKELSRDVVVVGAGVAGLAAADDLRRAGLSVAVFDAGDSPGVAWKAGASASGRSTPVPGERTTPVQGEEELRGTLQALALESVLDSEAGGGPEQVPLLLAERLGPDVLLERAADVVVRSDHGIIAEASDMTVRARFAIMSEPDGHLAALVGTGSHADPGPHAEPGSHADPAHTTEPPAGRASPDIAAALRQGREAAAVIIEASRRPHTPASSAAGSGNPS